MLNKKNEFKKKEIPNKLSDMKLFSEERDHTDKKILEDIDVFEYCLKNITLKKDHPVQVDMIEPIKVTSYDNIYHVDIKEMSVKKALMFKNETNHPLTNGPVSIISKCNNQNRFLNHGQLFFTDPGEMVVIQTTTSMDILLKVDLEKKELRSEKVWDSILKRKEMTIKVELENTLNSTKAICVVECSAPG